MLLKVLRLIPFVAMLCVPAFAGPSLPIPDDTLISMQRGNCEVMECPVYRVVVFANGDVVWQGRGRVSKLGVALGGSSAIKSGHLSGVSSRSTISIWKISTATGARAADRPPHTSRS